MPLCMGIAVASGVPAERGLITGIIGGIIVGALAGSPLQVSGPAAGLAVIVFEIVQARPVGMLGPILILAGLIQLIAGAAKLGNGSAPSRRPSSTACWPASAC
jgi:MFS superfamily sulfate permease-like transporter